MWNIDNGIITLTLKDGRTYYPRIAEIITRKENSMFIYEGTEYPPVSELPFRFSNIGISQVVVTTESEPQMSISLHVQKRGQSYILPFIVSVNRFADYVIINNVCYPVYGCCQTLNEIITAQAINPKQITFIQYMKIMRSMNQSGMQIVDDGINRSVEHLRTTEEQECETKGLQANLFPYQKSGLNWLSFMVENGCGCILGDEMGLGKTLQVIATFGHIKETNGGVHCLVVCPVSLLENWKREIAKFYPSLSVFINHGYNRTRFYDDLLQYDVVVIAYSSLQTDNAMLQMIDWDVIVTDEAQNIKNPRALRTQYLKRLSRKAAIAVSGTPFENHMTDVWSLVDFVLPNYLGSLRVFESQYGDDMDSARVIEKLISPIMLRRRVKDVGHSLPKRIDVPVPIVMTQEEASYYENGRLATEKDFGLVDMHLDKIQKLRMFCTHPMVYDSTFAGADPIMLSNKYARMCELLEEIFLYREKVIVFTSFSKMINIIVEDVRRRFNVYTNYIDGSVASSKRQEIVDVFSSVAGSAVLVLNPTAAGSGLNITAANHVIHYNLEWNPSKEDQASARAYRTGQTKNVVVHRLYYVDTIEEIINEMIQQKRELSETVIVGNVGNAESREQLIKALRMSPYKKGE